MDRAARLARHRGSSRPAASRMRSLSLRMCTTSGRPVSASTAPERDQLVGVGVAARRVDEAGGHPARALVEAASAAAPCMRASLGRVGAAVLAAHHVLAERAVRHEVGHVLARAPPRPRGPGTRRRTTSPTPRRSRRAGRPSFCFHAPRSSGRTGRHRDAVLAEDLERDPLAHLHRQRGIGEHLEVRVAVGVDEARGTRRGPRSRSSRGAARPGPIAAMRPPSMPTSASKRAARRCRRRPAARPGRGRGMADLEDVLRDVAVRLRAGGPGRTASARAPSG